MQLKKLFTEERAASPVVGILLLVTLTVILAAIIGTFVLDVGQESTEIGPNSSFSLTGSDDYVDQGAGEAGSGEPGIQVTHESGDDVENATVQIVVDGQGLLTDSGAINGSLAGVYDVSHPNATSPSDPWESGESYTIVADDETTPVAIENGDTVRVVWKSTDTGQSATLFEDTVEL